MELHCVEEKRRKKDRRDKGGARRTAIAGFVGAFSMLAVDQAAAQLDEIVVTATRREEALQDIPISVSAYDGSYLENARVQNFDDVLSLVPGAIFFNATGANGSFPAIRGSSFNDDSPAADLPVAFFIDDVFMGSSGASFNVDLFDVEQVAVLRGPQGTTFGRNVTGGAIQITSKRPVIGEREAQLTLGVRNRPGFEARGFVNQPVGDRGALRLSFQTRRVDGHTENETLGRNVGEIDVWSVRAQVLYEINESLDLLLLGSYSQDNSRGIPRELIIRGVQPSLLPVGPSGFALNPDPRIVNNNEEGFTDRYSWRALMRLDWDTSWGTVTSITAGRGFDSTSAEDVVGSPLPELLGKADFQEEAQFSQEIRIASPGGQFVDYVFGAFLMYAQAQRTEINPFRLIPGSVLDTLTGGAFSNVDGNTHQQVDTFSVAPFGEVVVNPTDWLALRAGARFTYDDKRGEIVHFNAGNPFTGPLFDVPIGESWSEVTPRFAIEVKPNDDLLVYGSISKGFKSGGWSLNNSTPATAQAPFAPETVWSYEVGLKSSLFDDRMTANVTAFLAETSDLQLRQFDGVSAFVTRNAAETRARGVEVELNASLTEQATVGGAYGYTYSSFEEFPNCNSTGGVDCAGNLVPFVPVHTLTVFGQYTALVANGELTFRTEYSYNSAYRLDELNSLGTVRSRTARDAYVNASLNFEPTDANWSVSLWGRNILDDEALSSAVNFTNFVNTLPEALGGNQSIRAVYDTPRQFGASVTFGF